MSRAPVAILLVAALALGSGCGSEPGDSTTPTAALAPAPVTTPTQPDPLGEAEPEIVTTTAPATTATAEPDAGDEEGIRVPADFTLEDGALTPGQITVPPQLPIAVTVRATDGKAHELLFSTTPPVTVDVPAGSPGTARIPGQRKGVYTVNVDGGPPLPALVAVDDAGP